MQKINVFDDYCRGKFYSFLVKKVAGIKHKIFPKQKITECQFFFIVNKIQETFHPVKMKEFRMVDHSDLFR
jgi:hypothetical protein